MSISDERLALAEEVIQRWAQWIIHVSEDMEESEWPTASANSVANDRDFVLSVLQSLRAAAKVRAIRGDGEADGGALAAAIQRLIGKGNALVGYCDTPEAIEAGAAVAYNGWKREVEAAMPLALQALNATQEGK